MHKCSAYDGGRGRGQSAAHAGCGCTIRCPFPMLRYVMSAIRFCHLVLHHLWPTPTAFQRLLTFPDRLLKPKKQEEGRQHQHAQRGCMFLHAVAHHHLAKIQRENITMYAWVHTNCAQGSGTAADEISTHQHPPKRCLCQSPSVQELQISSP